MLHSDRPNVKYNTKIHPVDQYQRPSLYKRRCSVAGVTISDAVDDTGYDFDEDSDINDDDSDEDDDEADDYQAHNTDADLESDDPEDVEPQIRTPDPKATRHSTRTQAQIQYEYRRKVHPQDAILKKRKIPIDTSTIKRRRTKNTKRKKRTAITGSSKQNPIRIDEISDDNVSVHSHITVAGAEASSAGSSRSFQPETAGHGIAVLDEASVQEERPQDHQPEMSSRRHHELEAPDQGPAFYEIDDEDNVTSNDLEHVEQVEHMVFRTLSPIYGENVNHAPSTDGHIQTPAHSFRPYLEGDEALDEYYIDHGQDAATVEPASLMDPPSSHFEEQFHPSGPVLHLDMVNDTMQEQARNLISTAEVPTRSSTPDAADRSSETLKSDAASTDDFKALMDNHAAPVAVPSFEDEDVENQPPTSSILEDSCFRATHASSPAL